MPPTFEVTIWHGARGIVNAAEVEYVVDAGYQLPAEQGHEARRAEHVSITFRSGRILSVLEDYDEILRRFDKATS